MYEFVEYYGYEGFEEKKSWKERQIDEGIEKWLTSVFGRIWTISDWRIRKTSTRIILIKENGEYYELMVYQESK